MPNTQPSTKAFGTWEDEHAKLGASSAYRWLACPGSVLLDVPEDNTSSPYAAEGTLAHMIAEGLLRKFLLFGDIPARSHNTTVGQTYKVDGHEFIVDHQFFAHVLTYTDYCMELLGRTKDGGQCWLEQQVDLKQLWDGNPPAPMFGTVDFACIEGDTVHVADLKFGIGVDVGVDESPQFPYYALGLLYLLLGKAGVGPIRYIELHVVQPRTRTGNPISTKRMSVIDLLQWGYNVLKPGVERVVNGDTTLSAGEHCQFCRKLAACPEQYSQIMRVMQMNGKTGEPVAVEVMTPQERAEALGWFKAIRGWMRAVENQVMSDLQEGVEVPGFKMVEKRSNRTWTDPEKVLKMADMLDRSLRESLIETKLVSPTQLGLVNKDAYQALERLVTRPVSGLTYAPLSDKRPAVIGKSAADSFPDDL